MPDMSGLTRLVEAQIDHRGILKVLLAPMTIVGALATLGFFSGTSAVAIISLIAGAVAAVTLVSWLGLRNRQLRHARDRSTLDAASYAGLLLELRGLDYDIDLWEETQTIDSKGMSFQRRLKLRATGNEPLFMTRVTQEPPYNGSSLSARQRSRVTFSVRMVDGDGEEGARLSCTHKWVDGDRLALYARFKQPLNPGDCVELMYRMAWPGYTTPLTDGGVDIYRYRFHRKVGAFRFVLKFMPDLELPGLRVTTVSNITTKARTERQDNAWVLIAEAESLDGESRFAYHLDI